jgi:hypothetical protein
MKNLELLIPQAKTEPTDKWRWATVTAVSPLRIRLDGEAEPLDITPDTLAGPLSVGDRVWTQTSGRRILVAGVSGGDGGGSGGGEPSQPEQYEFTQSDPASTWTIPHHLGRSPISVEVRMSDGAIADGYSIIHTEPGVSTTLVFDIAFSGSARLS